LQYGLDYPDEVKGLVIMTVAAKPKTRAPDTYEMRLRAAKEPRDEKAYGEWLAFQLRAMQFVEPGLRDRLFERHKQVGPMSQYHDLKTIDAFDVRDRISSLKPKLLIMRGLNDHGNPPEYEKEIHEAVPGSEYMRLPGMGHFPLTEFPDKLNPVIEKFVAGL
jgi:pimeloyl-ACP methyl ester carboxylesterase